MGWIQYPNHLSKYIGKSSSLNITGECTLVYLIEDPAGFFFYTFTIFLLGSTCLIVFQGKILSVFFLGRGGWHTAGSDTIFVQIYMDALPGKEYTQKLFILAICLTLTLINNSK